MAGTYQLLFLAFATLYLGIRLVHSYNRRRLASTLSCKPVRDAPSGPFGLVAFYHMTQAVKSKSWLPWFESEFRKNGTTFGRPLMGRNLIMTCEPQNIKALLATQFADFGLGTRYQHLLPLLGDGIFTLDGNGWSHSRALLRPQFSREQVADIQQLDVHMGHFMSHIPSDGSSFDIQELFFRLTLDSSTDFLFGESVNSLVSTIDTQSGVPVKGRQGFEAAFNLSQDYLAARSRAQGLYWLINSKEFREANRICHQLVDYYVKTALEPTADRDIKSPQDRERYIFLEALAKDTRDPKLLRDQLLNILLAGRDTTASLLSSVFYELARNPKVWAILRNEIVERFGTAKKPKAEISFTALKDIPYLRYVLDEALRMYPPVPLNVRTALKDTTLPVGGGANGLSPIFITKGTSVIYSVWAMHRRPDLWGQDAAKFRPERWEGGNLRGWQYLPFNGGPRICLGQQYALTEAGFVVVKLLQSFEAIESAIATTRDPLINSNLTMSHENGVHIRLFPSAAK
ncbi:putative cytochrome P450 alkane hydroxylase [Cadophora sp. MPI-SDFR-AT-0126]|nr:putative cytochrome P450 alkane hydroxylase [Leotiomycetes sp. MPI-SDFR-AT-0126]